MAGFHFSSAGTAWESAYESALAFLDGAEGTLLLGPAIGSSGRAWIEHRFLAERGVRFGSRVQPWHEWVKAQAREHALAVGRGFRALNRAGKREHLRILARHMSETGVFHHLQSIWEDEKFFAALLDCVTEARLAGLDEAGAIERARETLAAAGDEASRAAYEDFWNLLNLYEAFLAGGESGGLLDEASLLRLAAAEPRAAEPLFLLGFDHLSALETELLQRWAQRVKVFIPLALPEPRIREALREQIEDFDLPVELALRGLLTGFSGERVLVPAAEPAAPVRRRLLSAHTPAEEARAAAALARAGFAQFEELRFVVPDGYLDDRAAALPFREELGLPENFRARKALGHPVSRLFFHVLEIKERGYPLAQGLEVAKLLEFTRGEYRDLASRAARAGVRRGLADWKRKAAGDPVLQDFGAFLEKLDRLLPESGNAQRFAEVTEQIAREVGIAELARRAPELEIEREAHAALASVLDNSLMLAAATRAEHEFSFRAWVNELKVALGTSAVGEVLSLFPKVQFYRYGEWLPPANERTLTLALGLNSGAGPRPGFQFFLEESARRRLSDLLLPTNVQNGLQFLDGVRRLALGRGPTLLSWWRHDDGGGEGEPHWVTHTLDLEAGEWPEVPRETRAEPFRPSGDVRVGDPALPSFSASFFELYKECPFKAFAERVLQLEDKVQESSLDISRLEEGSFVHKALELFYGKHDGKAILDEAERARVLGACVEEATAQLKVEYFKGNETLFNAQVARLQALLADFLRLDAEQYARFPFFGRPEVEKQVRGTLAGKHFWQGKIDRVDFDEENKRFLVTDYKIGASPPANAEVNELRRFQLQLYVDAVAAERPGWEALGGTYASVTSGERGTGFLRKEFASAKGVLKPGEVRYYKAGAASKALHEPPAFDDLRNRSRAEVERLAEKAAAGEFPVEPLEEESSCGRCPVRPACRIGQLRSPPLEPWPRPAPAALLALLDPPVEGEKAAARERRFNPEQTQALERRGGLVFIEASAGTGKTTVIVERVRRFLAERPEKEKAHLAVEKFRAISFTEKSAQELAARLAVALAQDPGFGPRVAAQAQAQVSTIHGFCRKLIADFPLEAGVSPLATMLDQKGAEALKREVVEDFFLFPEEEAAAKIELALREFSRAKVESILVRLLENRFLFAEEIASFRAGTAAGDRLFPSGGARDTLLNLLELADRLAESYDGRKREEGLLDFNDLESLSLKVLEHESVREHYRRQFELLLVDEFQDTNAVQREIFERLARPGWSNLFVVGDAKQSIYRFRAADVSVFQALRREAELKGSLVTLGRNYRSRKEIVEVANRVTAAVLPAPGEDAPDFEATNAPAIAEASAGGKVALVEYGEPDRKWAAGDRRAHEAKLVARLVRELQSRPNPPGTVAVLLRKFSGNEAYLRALTDAGVSFRVGASKGFYGQPLVTDAIALLRTLYGAKNDLALLAVLRSPWARLTDRRILEIQRRGPAKQPLREKIQAGEIPLLEGWERLAAHSSLAGVLEKAFAEYPQGRREHLQAVKLLSIVDGLEAEARPRAEILELLSNWAGWESLGDGADDSIMPEPGTLGTVQVMTVHAAKGLEFDVTILADLCGKLVPDNSALRMVRGAGMVLKLESEEKSEAHTEIGRRNTAREVAELKRLFYVAITRAKQEEYFFLPRSFTGDDRAKWSSCAHFLRAADLEGAVEKIDGDSWGEAAQAPGVREEENGEWPLVPRHGFFRTSSITEIADFNTCAEFHRLKNVQRWNDRIVALWDKPKNAFRKQQHRKKFQTQDPESERVAKLLKKLKIERKERGIALHRVLERVKDRAQGLELAGVWLREAYEAQGVNPAARELGELLSVDLDRLGRFLASDLGAEFFSPDVRAFPEVPFQWSVGGVVLHGAIDRLIQKPDGTWVVIDYKSSIQEQSLDDYRFQVASYMAAVRESERIRNGVAPRVRGFLVDLFAARSLEVEANLDDAIARLRAELESTAGGYTLQGVKSNLVVTVPGNGSACFSCPYSFHCEIGKEIVLAFS